MTPLPSTRFSIGRLPSRAGTSSKDSETQPKKRLTPTERVAAAAKKEKNHETYVKRIYGLDRGEYAQRLARQSGGCAICGKRPRKRYLAVDHDHGNGRVRGLLCFFCNTAIGVFEFDQATAERASRYLKDIAFNLRPPVTPTGAVEAVRRSGEVDSQEDVPF